MSKNYEFSAMLNTNYTKENVLSILKNGEKIGCVYNDYSPREPQSNIISTHTATELIWSRLMKKYEFGPFILAHYSNTHFRISFYNRNNKIYLCISSTHTAWKKRYDLCAWFGINFYRYQMFMLRLIGNNIITHFETYEYFYASYNAENKAHDRKIYVKLYTYWAYDIYHHLKVNGKMLHITWLDSNKQPINIKVGDNTLENIIHDEDTNQCWYGVFNNITLKFSLHKKRVFTVEPIDNSGTNISVLTQKQIFDNGLRATMELFKNLPTLRFITFQNDEDIEIINKMDEWP